MRIVLNVARADAETDSLTWLALVEHQLIERYRRMLNRSRSLLMRVPKPDGRFP